jgi:hypothetical protein
VELWRKPPPDIVADAASTNTPAGTGIIMELEGRLHRLAMLMDFAGEKVPDFQSYGTAALLEDLRTACTNDGQGASDSGLPPPPLRAKTVLIRSTGLLLQLRGIRRDVLPRGWIARWRRRFRISSAGARADDRQYWTAD